MQQLRDPGSGAIGRVLPKQELRALYHLSRIFVSVAVRGFRLTAARGNGLRHAGVAARSSAIPEVVGRSGLLVNPYRIDAIAEAIRSLLENSSFRTH